MQVLNYFAGQPKQVKVSENTTNTTTIVSERNKQYEAVSQQRKDDIVYKNQTDIIKQFLDKCNEKDIEGAYDLLSDNCKQVKYPSINDFIDGYYNNNFDGKKSYSYQAWNGNTYKIELRPDILATGMYDESAYVEDYYTIRGDKLNIDGYITKKNINKEIEKEKITIKVIDIDFFRDYSICNVQVFNKTNNEILLDTREKENTVYMTDKKEVKYSSYISELNEEELRVLSGENKNIEIKFNCIYRENTIIKKLVFTNIVMNYDNYINNRVEEKEIKKIEVEI